MVVVLIGERLSTLPSFIPNQLKADGIIMSTDFNFNFLLNSHPIHAKGVVIVDLDRTDISYNEVIAECKHKFPNCLIWGYSADASPSIQSKLSASGFDKIFTSDDNPAEHLSLRFADRQ